MANSYQDLYTWSHGLKTESGELLCHTDGAISCVITWDGLQTGLRDSKYIEGIFKQYHAGLSSISDYDITIENHFYRDYNDTVVDEYLEYGRNHMVRCHEFGQRVRDEMAHLIRSLAMKTEVLCVLTIRRRVPLTKLIFSRSLLNNRHILAQHLLLIANNMMRHLKGAKLLSYSEIEASIWQTYHRDKSREGRIPSTNSRFKVNQRVATKPVYDDGLIRLGKTYTKTILLIDYPDARQNWFFKIARLSGVEIHLSQVIQLADKQRVTQASTYETKKSLEAANTFGGEEVRDKVDDHNAFRAFLSKHNLSAYKNCFIVKFHSTSKSRVLETTKEFYDLVGSDAVEAGSSPELCFAIWRYSQIAQGHLSRFMRVDHALQVVNMAPIISFNRGNKIHPQAIRLDNNSQAITYGYSESGGNHAITGAKTGAGKGVDVCCEISELYPLGIDFNIMEVGTDDGASYEWVVEAFGGQYFHLDMNTVVSPFPEYRLADSTKPKPLDDFLSSCTIGVLMPLLSKGHEDIDQHIQSVAIQLLNNLYLNDPEDGIEAPSLGTYYDVVCSAMDNFTGIQRQAVEVIRDNLHSFLSGVGSNFRKSDSIHFGSGIVGLNFKNIMESPELAKFLLVFISMRFKQLAFSSENMVRIIIDELDSFIDIDKELMKSLLKQLARKGRKDAGAMHAISQEALDADLEKGILNQVSTANLMFLKSGHEETSKIFKMSQSSFDVWTSFDDPESIEVERGYRESIKLLGSDAFQLHLKFPPFVLNLGNTSKTALKLKSEIRKMTDCPFERLTLLDERLKEVKQMHNIHSKSKKRSAA